MASLRTMTAEEKGRLGADIAAKWAALRPWLDELGRRVWLAVEAQRLGYGGVKFVADATGTGKETIRRGIADLEEGGPGPEREDRARRPGGGRKRGEDRDPGLWPALEAVLQGDGNKAGDPMTPRLMWTSKSLANITGELRAQGHECSESLALHLMTGHGWRLQSNNKSIAKGARHPDRDGQFRYISDEAAAFAAAGLPVVSVDTKKKELVGNYANRGREWAPRGRPVRVLDHDFPEKDENKKTVKAIPYGIYDVGANEGFISVGDDRDTPRFAVASLEAWWTTLGKERYHGAAKLLVTADSGGSNSATSRVWKKELAAFAERHQVEVTVLHYPSGTSKWNQVEHRLFSFISLNWRGRPLTSYETILELIGGTTTKTGLTVTAARDTGTYPKGESVTDKDMRKLNHTRVTRHDWHPDWNYTIHTADKPETSIK